MHVSRVALSVLFLKLFMRRMGALVARPWHHGKGIVDAARGDRYWRLPSLPYDRKSRDVRQAEGYAMSPADALHDHTNEPHRPFAFSTHNAS
jgi:hypothetical protein